MNPIFVAAGGLLVASLLAKPLLSKLRLNKAQTFVLKSNLVEVHISALGGIIQRLLVADKNGAVDDIVLGHDKLSDYLVRLHAMCMRPEEPCTTLRNAMVRYTNWAPPLQLPLGFSVEQYPPSI